MPEEKETVKKSAQVYEIVSKILTGLLLAFALRFVDKIDAKFEEPKKEISAVKVDLETFKTQSEKKFDSFQIQYNGHISEDRRWKNGMRWLAKADGWDVNDIPVE